MCAISDLSSAPTQLLNAAALDRLIQEKKVRRKWHPAYPQLAVYKYSVGYDFFDESDADTGIVKACRGLVYDHEEGRIVCRGMPKFFNHFRYTRPQLEQLFSMDYVVQEKVDGSCVLLWHYLGNWHFSTLGSFESEQARRASQHFDKLCGHMIRAKMLNPLRTYVFEVMYPGNEVVLSYGMEEKLIYLCEFDNQTGHDRFSCKFSPVGDGVGLAHPLPDPITLDDLIRSVEEDDFREGFVVRFEPGEGLPAIRLKFKTKWYFEQTAFISGIRRHGLVKTLFKYYKARRQVPCMRNVGDEYVVQVHALVDRLAAAVFETTSRLGRLPTRKEQAAHVLGGAIPSHLKSALFAGLDGNTETVRFMVWKTLEDEKTDAIGGAVVKYETILSDL